MISFSGLPGEFPGASPFNLPKAPCTGVCRVQMKASPPGLIHESIQSQHSAASRKTIPGAALPSSPNTDRGHQEGKGGGEWGVGRSSDSPAPLDTNPTDPSMGTPAQGREHTQGGGLREDTEFPWEICF